MSVGVLCGAGAFVFTGGPLQPAWSGAYATAVGFVSAGIVFWHGLPLERWDGGFWRFVCLLFVVAVATPFFQVARDAGRWETPYARLHRYAWTNVVMGASALVVSAVAWLPGGERRAAAKCTGAEWDGQTPVPEGF